jgi:hypothetical protein
MEIIKHEPTEMVFRGRFPRKSRPTKTFRNGKNIWFSVYDCPTCGDVLRRLANVGLKSVPFCDGEKYAKQNVLRRSQSFSGGAA